MPRGFDGAEFRNESEALFTHELGMGDEGLPVITLFMRDHHLHVAHISLLRGSQFLGEGSPDFECEPFDILHTALAVEVLAPRRFLNKVDRINVHPRMQAIVQTAPGWNCITPREGAPLGWGVPEGAQAHMEAGVPT